MACRGGADRRIGGGGDAQPRDARLLCGAARRDLGGPVQHPGAVADRQSGDRSVARRRRHVGPVAPRYRPCELCRDRCLPSHPPRLAERTRHSPSRRENDRRPSRLSRPDRLLPRVSAAVVAGEVPPCRSTTGGARLCFCQRQRPRGMGGRGTRRGRGNPAPDRIRYRADPRRSRRPPRPVAVARRDERRGTDDRAGLARRPRC
jgi:hypothetical protein